MKKKKEIDVTICDVCGEEVHRGAAYGCPKDNELKCVSCGKDLCLSCACRIHISIETGASVLKEAFAYRKTLCPTEAQYLKEELAQYNLVGGE